MRRQVKAEAVRRELLPGESEALLRELHLLTRGGDLNADALRKLKQVNHLAGLLAPAVDDVLSRFGDPLIVDCGAGKSYLGFILYQLFLAGGDRGTILSIESRADLARAAEERAARLGFSRMRFQAAAVEAAELPGRVHLVTALHACDTATDDALALAIRRGADHVAVVPCCQAEVARQLERARGTDEALAALHERPWHRREFGSHLTNVVRALALEAHGYRVTVTELTGWEHSLKNELILGRKVRGRSAGAEARLAGLLAATGVRPKLVRLLETSP
ncbi:MAG TPA: SAM-dependent methyltransferase [Anaeromyxobacteraceae bacterium]|nr:SAM-dependent methyltransferase [Anaeromyxobacteraceae bacterium]